jgi:cell division septal protein FtsQ
MRDYKNVKVPRKYRTATGRTSVKRVETGRAGGRNGKSVAAGFKTVLLNVLVVAVIAGGSWLGWQAYLLLTRAEVFQISGVDAKGVRHLSEADLESIAGMFKGQNIFRVDLDAAARRTHANPWVKEVRIYRHLPNRISMTVVERVPGAILDTGAGRYLIDDEMVVIGRIAMSEASPWPLPVVAVKDCKAIPGEPVNAEGMAEALTLLAEIAARGGWSLSKVMVKANSPETLSVVYAAHEFKIGSGNYAEKLRRLAEVMADVKQRGLDIAYVDLRPERQAAAMVVKNTGTKPGVQGTGSRGKGKIPNNKHQMTNKYQ